MAKNMARIENGVVINIEWCSDMEPETDTLKDCGDIRVEIGDTYQDGNYYRDGTLLLSSMDAMQAEMQDMQEALSILEVSVNG